MAKLTQQEISELKVIRANYIGNSWRILFSDNGNKFYVVDVNGLETDTDDELLKKSNIALLEADKQEEVAQPIIIERTNIVGESPKTV